MRDTFLGTACRTAVALAMCGSVLGIASFTVAEFARVQSPSASSDGRSGILANSATRVDLPVSASQLSFLQADPDSAVESGRDALGSGGRFPWYDSAREDLRPIDIQADHDNSSPDSSKDRRSEGGGPSGNSSRRGGGSGSGNGSGRGSDSRSSRSENPSLLTDPQTVNGPALLCTVLIRHSRLLLFNSYLLLKPPSLPCYTHAN